MIIFGGDPMAEETLSPRDEAIRQSHRRSEAFGLSETMTPEFDRISGGAMLDLVDRNRLLHVHALPVMTTLHEQIINTRSVVLLTDPTGVVLHSIGDPEVGERVARVGLAQGVQWSEQSKGTNAIGTAIADEKATLVHGKEHYLTSNKFLTCSASPIFDPSGKIMGVLDVTGDQRSYHGHTMALVKLSAEMIESHIFRSSAREHAFAVYFHCRPEFINTMLEGIVSFDGSGRVRSANRQALTLLGMTAAGASAHTFSSLFGLPLSALYDHYRGTNPQLLMLNLSNGLQVFAQAHINQANRAFALGEALSKPSSAVPVEPSPASYRSPWAHLDQLDTGHEPMTEIIGKLRKIIDRDIPFLILGETGTGKEVLARAIHNDSRRRNSPFIAVNCASIPENLIESELFGYEDGAFTGARKKGSMGKFLQANGGTLFLDEIGDMPASLQTRLLRVLQEHAITPLGSSKTFSIDVQIICATHQNLRDLIAEGAFREDLYYRLNGLVVKLPSLRDRTDREAIIRNLLEVEAKGRQVGLSNEVKNLFATHHWPGNIRQMANVIRTAVIMADQASCIERHHLPDDFLEEVSYRPDSGEGCESNAADVPLSHMESQLIKQALDRHGGNISAAARQLGVSRTTIYRRLLLTKTPDKA
jgi:transcriptional regulator of acetoin/glycerol metabolism